MGVKPIFSSVFHGRWSSFIMGRLSELMKAQWEWNPFLSAFYCIWIDLYLLELMKAQWEWKVKPIFIGFSLYLNWSLSSWIDGSVMGVKPIFYRLSMVDESIFIFFYYGPTERTNESVMKAQWEWNPFLLAFHCIWIDLYLLQLMEA
jgi:hypothetical protein